MGVKIKFNTAQLEASIAQNADRALANGARSLRRVAERVEKLAKEFAPVDDGDLEEAIETIESVDSRRRKQFVVRVNPDRIASTDEDGSTTKVVGDYALLMERDLAPYGSGVYNLGKKSQDKAASGNDVGGRFMRRAFEKGASRAKEDVAGAVQRTLGGGRRLTPAQSPLLSRADYEGQGE